PLDPGDADRIRIRQRLWRRKRVIIVIAPYSGYGYAGTRASCRRAWIDVRRVFTQCRRHIYVRRTGNAWWWSLDDRNGEAARAPTCCRGHVHNCCSQREERAGSWTWCNRTATTGDNIGGGESNKFARIATLRRVGGQRQVFATGDGASLCWRWAGNYCRPIRRVIRSVQVSCGACNRGAVFDHRPCTRTSIYLESKGKLG